MNESFSVRVGKHKLGARVGKYKFGPRPVNTNLGRGLVKKNLGPGPVNANSKPGPVNTNWGPGPKQKLGARFGGQAKSRRPGNTNTLFFIKKTFDQIRFVFLSERAYTNIDLK